MAEDLDKTQAFPQTYDDRSTMLVGAEGAGAPVAQATGARLENHYPVVEVRGGRGVTGMGVVYIVEDSGQLLAVKTFQRRFARELAFIERFVREARTWMLIGFHPNIVHAYRVEIIDAIPYLFMEYVPGDTLGRHSLAEYLRGGLFPVSQALDFGLQFCEGMAHAVRAVPGLAHRDIKPDNVLIGPDGTLKITDFGLVRARGDEDTALAALARSVVETKGRKQLTEIGSVFGTPAYMAPEQFQGAQKAVEASDIYSFGCILYEMICGRAPFRADDAQTVEKIAVLRQMHVETPPKPLLEQRPECPPALAAIAMRCLEKAPEDRWPSFEALRDALRELYPAIRCEPAPAHPSVDALPQAIAAQSRSITLLDGYTQAVRLKRLRERHEESPYAFHLALASYFHCQGDTHEERLQLERALEARTTELGSEAVRRLTELHLKEGRAEEAVSVAAAFAAQGSVAADQVLEPHVFSLIATQRLDEARVIIETLGHTRRGHWLRVALARATGDADELHRAGTALLGLVMEELLGHVDLCGDIGEPGFGYPGDPAVLAEVLAELAPGTDTASLKADPVYWPDLGGMPDFSGPMAWLSEACGALGDCATLDAAERAKHARAAARLGWPKRMREHLEREEFWFWMQQALPVSDRCHAGK